MVKSFSTAAAAVVCSLVLSGCGSDSNSGGETGLLLDSPVINIGYRTESEDGTIREGVTNSLGEYRFREGDTVTFFIGDLEFPEVDATGIVTPLELAGTTDVNDDEVVNILRLLQTLDQDGNPDNGITITETAKTVATPVNFDQDQGAFAVAVDNLIENGGQDSPVTDLIDAHEAIANFEDQLDELSLVGSWLAINNENDVLALVFFEDGTYAHMEVEQSNQNEESGLEWGTYEQDIATGRVVATQTFDSNGDTGLTEFVAGDVAPFLYIERDGDELVISADDDGDGNIDQIVVFEEQVNGSNSLLGTWQNTSTENELLFFTFFADGTYIHAEVDEEEANSEVSGMEYGTYSRNAGTGLMTVTQEFDENGDTGITDFVGAGQPNLYIQFEPGKLVFELDEVDGPEIDDEIEFFSLNNLF